MSYLNFTYRQLFDAPKPTSINIDLSGLTAIVTGSNVGLGLEACRELVQRKLSRLIIAVRDVQKGECARGEIQAISNDCNIEVWELDQDSFSSTVVFCKRAQALERLDITILNAGVMKDYYARSSAGHEQHLQVNYLSTVLLSLLLFPRLKATATLTGKPSHLSIVTSELHAWTAFEQRSAPDIFQVLNDEKSFHADNYNITKLLEVLWIQELAPKIKSKEVIVNAVNPGFCWSQLQRDHQNWGLWLFKVLVGWSTAQGGHCLVDAVIAKGAESHGLYLSEQKVTP